MGFPHGLRKTNPTEICQPRKKAEFRWDLREIEVVISKIQPLKMNKAEKAAVGDHRTIETAATEVKANHMTSVLIAFNTIPGAAISVHPFLFPRCNLRISKRIIPAIIHVYVKAFFELQQGRALIIMAKWLHRRKTVSGNSKKQCK